MTTAVFTIPRDVLYPFILPSAAHSALRTGVSWTAAALAVAVSLCMAMM